LVKPSKLPTNIGSYYTGTASVGIRSRDEPAGIENTIVTVKKFSGMASPLAYESSRKVVLLGNSGVGKTSIATRWANNTFNLHTISTVGASNVIKEVSHRGKSFKIALWDTAGQEQFRSVAPLYLRGARCAITVCSAIEIESFDSISTWLDLLVSANENSVPVICAVNKMDLLNSSEDSVREFIEGHRSKFSDLFYVSALRGDEIENLFAAVAEAVHQDRPSDVGETNQPQFLIDDGRNCCPI
jgi:small GTP-binding protein